MSDVGQVIAQMIAYDMPALPAGHPVLDGKYKRFGKGKKAWYILREMTLKSGRTVITGAFGFFQGENRNTVPVTVDMEAMSEAEKDEYVRQNRATEKAEAEKRDREVRMAANRARDQWNKSAGNPVAHAYLVRKQVASEGLRVSDDGLLLLPFSRDGQLVGLQKIDQDGEKRFNGGFDKKGAALALGQLAGASLIACGEGYATCSSARLSLAPAIDLPVVVAIDAGNIIHVAKRLRRDYPDAHLLFLADDDYQLTERYVERLREEFNVSVTVAIDGESHLVLADDGTEVTVTAWWRTDPQGIAYIEADMRNARRMRNHTYKNAGVASCEAAAKAVGNASVVMPLFAHRGDRKLTDFNDLHAEEGLEAVGAQLALALLAAEQRNSASPVLPAAQAATNDSPAADQAGVPGIPPAPLDDACQGLDDLPALRVEDADTSASPPPSKADAEPEKGPEFTLQWALAHCALVHGSTDVWDSLNKLRMKRPAFVEMLGKDTAKAWSAHGDRRLISPRNLPKTVRGVASQDGGAGGDNIVMMLDRYTLLYGTKTVYDAEKRSIIGYDAMALARGNDLASRWIAHPLHMEKDYDKVVFDPTQRVDLNTHINLFEGFPLKPRANDEKASLAVELLQSLCASESNGAAVVHWVLCWLAYPLQHPGAKMQTALLFFGEKQGTGKSLFFEGIVKPIYGAHGATGGQHQLEGSYTMWRSQKLYVLFEEILSRQDKYSYFGLIKHMITGRDTPISQKFKDDRTEANHMNVVMLSNEFQAVPIEPEDRRFQVVDVRKLLCELLLQKITLALNDGLIEAFYAFLLEYPLGDFNPHTKPVMTPSKERVINFGRPDWESFYLAWSRDELAAPWCSCLSTDLYLVFSRYASKYGLRTMSMTKFCEMIGQRVKKDRQWIGIGAAKKRLLSVFHVPYEPAMGEAPERGRQGPLSDQCGVFRDLADIRGDV